MFNLANKLTLLRILMSPLVVVLLYFPGPVTCAVAALIFVFAAVTDFADGYVARRCHMVSSMGKFLDPLADKLLISSVLIMLAVLGWAPAWVVIIIIARELTVTGLRAIAMDVGLVLAADAFGKVKTVLQIVAIVPITFHYPFFGLDLAPIGLVLLYASMLMAVYSGYNYCMYFYRHVKNHGDSRP